MRADKNEGAGLAFAFDARELIRAERFRASSPETARMSYAEEYGVPAALSDTLDADAVCCIAEALNLVYVTDPATVFEVCRVVIKGGQMWDGHGFTRGETPTLTPRKEGAEGED